MNKKLILAVILATLFLVSSIGQTQVITEQEITTDQSFVLSADYHQHFEFNVGFYSYQAYHGDKSLGHGSYGAFTAHYDDITFFIVDKENLQKTSAHDIKSK